MLVSLILALTSPQPVPVDHWRVQLEICYAAGCSVWVSQDEFPTQGQCLSVGREATSYIIEKARRDRVAVRVRGRCFNDTPPGLEA